MNGADRCYPRAGEANDQGYQLLEKHTHVNVALAKMKACGGEKGYVRTDGASKADSR